MDGEIDESLGVVVSTPFACRRSCPFPALHLSLYLSRPVDSLGNKYPPPYNRAKYRGANDTTFVSPRIPSERSDGRRWEGGEGREAKERLYLEAVKCKGIYHFAKAA